jgi:hypothetical protein
MCQLKKAIKTIKPVSDPSSQTIKMLGTRNWYFPGFCLHNQRLIKFCLYKITIVHELNKIMQQAFTYNWLFKMYIMET